MKKTIVFTFITLISSVFITAQAKECYNADTIDVGWTSYKTMSKIGVGGNFSKTTLDILHKNTPSVEDMMLDARVTLNLKNIDAHLALKNSNIATYFTSNLSSHKIKAQIVSIDDKNVEVKITLNNIAQVIPMSYTKKNSHLLAKGVIDALDFQLVTALRTLNKNVSGHKNKGWNDISISFDIPYTTTCK